MPAVRDLDVMIDLLRAIGAAVEQPGNDVVRVDASGDAARPRRPTSSSRRMRASFNVLGPLLARCGEARSRCRAATTSAVARSTCTCAASRRWAPTSRSCTASCNARADAAARRARRARVPERRRDREPHVRGGARQGHDRHRERGARTRGHRPRRVPRPHGRARGRRGNVDDRDRRRRGAACPPTARSWPTASRPARC